MSAPPQSLPRRAMAAGARAIFPLAVTAGPFGLIYGATAADSGLDPALAIANSWIVLAGAAQIALVELMADESPWTIAVGTALIINLRMLLYSASLAPSFREFPMRWRLGLAYSMTDQTSVTALLEYAGTDDPVWRRWFWFGAAAPFVGAFWVGTTVGVLLGTEVPDGVQIGFAVPLTFIALLVPTMRDRPTVAAAVAGGSVCVATMALPNGLNLVVGALAGVVVGLAVKWR